MLEGDVIALDTAILTAVARHRQPWLNGPAVDLTALGSLTLVVLLGIIAISLLLALRDRRGALQLTVAIAGSGGWLLLAKNWIERARPTEVSHLVEVSGYSYPSGHSLGAAAFYLTAAIIALRHVRGTGAQFAIFAGAVVVLILVSLSRIYLGVHYPSDVASGMSLGAAWALLLAALFAYRPQHVAPPRMPKGHAHE